MDNLLQKLQENFNLDNKHILIMKSLQFQDLTAKEICTKTGIQKGRIYGYLNFLLKNKLIRKTSKKPYLYSIKGFNHNVMEFIREKQDNLLRAQTEVMDLLEDDGLQAVEMITNSRKFTQIHLNMISESDLFKYISVHNSFPYLLYPSDYENFKKLREEVIKKRPTITYADIQTTYFVLKTYHDALEKGKEISVIFERDSFNLHVKIIKSLGNKFFTDWKKSLMEKFSKYNINAYVVDDYLPMQIDINNKRVNVSVTIMGKTNGIMMLSKKISKFYNKFFEDFSKRGTNVKDLIKKL